MFLCNSRPDICFAVNYFSQFTNNVSVSAWVHAKQILAYLKGTNNYVLSYKRQGKMGNLNLFADADWANDINDRRSISGYMIMLGNKTVFWKTKKQNLVTRNTRDAELISLSDGLNELLFFRKLLLDFKVTPRIINIFEDNIGCIRVIKNPNGKCKTKHLDINLKYITDTISKNNINLVHIFSNNQFADMLTKGLGTQALKEFCKCIGLFSRGEC